MYYLKYQILSNFFFQIHLLTTKSEAITHTRKKNQPENATRRVTNQVGFKLLYKYLLTCML